MAPRQRIKDPGRETAVWQYGTHSRTRLPDEAITQLRLAHKMRNTLVEAELAFEQSKKDLWSQYPQVASIETELETAEGIEADLIERTRREHSQDRTIATRTDTARQLAEVRKGIKVLRKARREGIGEAYLVLKPELEALKGVYKQKVTDIRQDYAERGLHWGTYNAVIDNHHATVRRIKAMHTEGRAAQIHFKRWRCEGSLTVQLQREAGDPRRSPDVLAGGEGKWRNVFQLDASGDPAEWAKLTDAQRKNSGLDRGTLMWSLGKKTQFTLPVTVHRPLPPGADVCRAQLTVRRTAGHEELTLTVTVDIPKPEPVQGGIPIAMHFGWRGREDGSVRTAVWASRVPLVVPETVADVVVSHDGGRWGEIILPAKWADQAGRPAALRSQRDHALEPVQRKLADWLDEHPQEYTRTLESGEQVTEQLTGADVRRWRAADRFASLALRWRDNPPEDGAEIAGLLKAWRVQDRHLWEWEGHLRRKIIRRRDDAWRRVGAWLGSQAGLVLLDDTKLTTLRQRPDVSETDPVLPGAPAQAARARAALAAPGRLRESVSKGSKRRGVTVDLAPKGMSFTRTHRTCGHKADPDPRFAASVMVVCPGCGQAYDQDHNAVLLMLDHRERPGGETEKGDRSQD